MEWADGRKYTGMHINDEMHGFGIFKSARGLTYEGCFVHDRRQGQGIADLEKGRYSGQWEADRQAGFGRMEGLQG